MNKIFTIALALMAAISSYASCPDGAGIADRDKNYSLYREFAKNKMYADAYPYWKWVMANAPGLRKQTYIDGVDMYTNFYNNATNEALKNSYYDTIMQLYAKRIECFGEAGFVNAKRAYDIALLKPTNGGYNDARIAYEKGLELGAEELQAYQIQAYYNILLALRANNVQTINDDYLRNKYDILAALIDKRIADPKNKDVADFVKLKTDLEAIYVKNVKPKEPSKPWNDGMSISDQITTLNNLLNSNPNDLKTVKEAYEKVRRAKELKDSTIRLQIEKSLYKLEPNLDLATTIGYRYFTNKNYNDAIIYFNEAMNLEPLDSNKAEFALTVADCYYRINKFSEARDAAKKALSYNPNMGQAYYMIGVLYASSGKLCGPGTGFESQKVLWPAFDYFYKAKEVDPSMTPDCDKMINDYKPFLPTKEDIAKKKLKEGQQYMIGCWINENATVRAKK